MIVFLGHNSNISTMLQCKSIFKKDTNLVFHNIFLAKQAMGISTKKLKLQTILGVFRTRTTSINKPIRKKELIIMTILLKVEIDFDLKQDERY